MTAGEEAATDRLDRYLDSFAERVKVEHDLISHRMTWLMTLNSFLIGGAAVLVANADKFEAKPIVLTAALTLICTAGAVSNSSCFYSNCWASVAIRGATCAVSSALGSGPNRAKVLAEMRLLGRDPRAFVRPDRFQPSELLHPWMLLPMMFVGTFSLASGLLGFLTGFTTGWQLLPLTSVVLLSVGLTAACRNPKPAECPATGQEPSVGQSETQQQTDGSDEMTPSQ